MYRVLDECRKCKVSIFVFRGNYNGFNNINKNCIVKELEKFVECKWE